MEKEILMAYPQPVVERAKSIRLLAFDVDGVLTNGQIVYTSQGEEGKAFNVKDGMAMKYLREAGILAGAITGRESAMVNRRAKELKFEFCEQGVGNKWKRLQKIMSKHELHPNAVAYIGDDLNDVGVLQRVGLAVTPADTPVYMQLTAHYTTRAHGGHGVLREVADLLLAAQGKFPGHLFSGRPNDSSSSNTSSNTSFNEHV